MSGLEYIVRPFQLPTITPPKRVIEGEKFVDNQVLKIGKSGSGLSFIYSLFQAPDFTVKEDDHTHTEVNRKEITKRVTNPDDPEQHVDIKVMSELQVRKVLNPTEYNIYKFKDQ